VRGETLDRVVASVDSKAITERDVVIEYRFEQFINGKQPQGDPDAQDREEIRNRLIEQALLAEEAASSALPAISQETLVSDLADIQKKFENEKAFRAALAAAGLNTDQVLERLRLRETILDLTDKRLRPQAWVERPEIEKYYNETFVPAFKRRNEGPAPVLPDVEGQIREILIQGKINKLLGEWISDLETTHRVELRSD
jgi:SurA-like N-terminal domain